MGDQDTAPGQLSEEHLRVCHSIDLMAYLVVRGLDLVRFARESRNGKSTYCFYYLDPDGASERYSADYVNSNCHRFDAVMKTLRSMIGQPSHPPRQRRQGGKGSNGHNQRHHGHGD
jgi:hypothetical protein